HPLGVLAPTGDHPTMMPRAPYAQPGALTCETLQPKAFQAEYKTAQEIHSSMASPGVEYYSNFPVKSLVAAPSGSIQIPYVQWPSKLLRQPAKSKSRSLSVVAISSAEPNYPTMVWTV